MDIVGVYKDFGTTVVSGMSSNGWGGVEESMGSESVEGVGEGGEGEVAE